jgi:hypothetical protein
MQKLEKTEPGAGPCFGNPPLIRPSRVERATSPFRYAVYDDFFPPDVHARLTDEFSFRLARGLFQTPTPNRLSRSQSRSALSGEFYDAYVVPLPAGVGFPLNIFYSTEFFDFFAKEFSIPFTPDLLARFHHHPTGSKDGWVHLDFHVCNFLNEPRGNGLNPHNGKVTYHGHCPPREGLRQPYRSLALIYYLANSEWQDGDGGETGLFIPGSSTEPVIKIAPLNNRLLAFEIGPTSLHAFRSNRRAPRNCITFWFHSECQHALDFFGVPPRDI